MNEVLFETSKSEEKSGNQDAVATHIFDVLNIQGKILKVDQTTGLSLRGQSESAKKKVEDTHRFLKRVVLDLRTYPLIYIIYASPMHLPRNSHPLRMFSEIASVDWKGIGGTRKLSLWLKQPTESQSEVQFLLLFFITYSTFDSIHTVS